MEGTRTVEMSLDFFQTTRSNNPKGSDISRREKLKSYLALSSSVTSSSFILTERVHPLTVLKNVISAHFLSCLNLTYLKSDFHFYRPE
jgi:hypothetical protein